MMMMIDGREGGREGGKERGVLSRDWKIIRLSSLSLSLFCSFRERYGRQRGRGRGRKGKGKEKMGK